MSGVCLDLRTKLGNSGDVLGAAGIDTDLLEAKIGAVNGVLIRSSVCLNEKEVFRCERS